MSELLDCSTCHASVTERFKESSGRIRIVCFSCKELLGLLEPKGFSAPKSITLHGASGPPQTIILAHIAGMRVEDLTVIVDTPGMTYRFEFVSKDQARRQLEQLQKLFE